tara:strand:- start:686 stop:1099 length:414 start_codon:yes stop_codon:yes gene_type:complete
MGLDQYAYAKPQGTEEQEELAYWRKHNRLQGWMEELWEDKGRPNFNSSQSQAMGDFNCQSVELTSSDIEQLEAHVNDKALPETGGFFFGDDSFVWTNEDGNEFADGDYYYKETDLKFIEDARRSIEQGKKVYYNSWW